MDYKSIYLDNNSTTPPDPQMMGVINRDYLDYWGNPSSPHQIGLDACNILESCRQSVSKLINVNDSNVIFTSGATESNFLVTGSFRRSVASATEHPSISCPLKIRVNPDGTIDLNHLEQILKRKDPALVCIQYANPETGVILDPNNDLAQLKNKFGFYYHIDATQGIGKILDFNPQQLGADTCSFSGHKIHAIKGIGALYISDRIKKSDLLKPIFKKSHQEFGIRSGTQNTIGIMSLAYIADKITSNGHYRQRILKISDLCKRLEESLLCMGVVNASSAKKIGNTISLSVDGIDDVDLLVEVASSLGLCISGRPACSTGLQDESSTIRAMLGRNAPQLKNTIRLSLGVQNTATEIELAPQLLKEAIEKIKE